MEDHIAKSPAVQGTLKERPLPRLLQQLYRKRFTGYFVIADPSRDENEVYVREGCPVHVRRPVDTDRLGNLLVEYGVVPADIVAHASGQVTPTLRLGAVLEGMGVLDKTKLAQVLKAQVIRQLMRLFFIVDGTYAVYVAPHAYGEGDELPLMRVDPRGLIYPAIRSAYDLPRLTQELRHLIGQRFMLTDVSPSFISGMGIPEDDATVQSLRRDYLTLDDLAGIAARPAEVRAVVLALFYADLLAREPIDAPQSDSAIPRAVYTGQSSDITLVGRPSAELSPSPSTDRSSANPTIRAPATNPAIRAPGAPQPRATPSPDVKATPANPRPSVPRTTPSPDQPPPRHPSGAYPVTGVGVPGASPGAPAGGAGRPAAAVIRTPFVSAVRAPAKGDGAPARSPSAAEPPTQASIQEMAAKLGSVTHFELLGIAQNATADDVSIAFVRAARQFHPDRLTMVGLQNLRPVAEKILAHINEAAMVLGDPARRAEYVASLTAGAPTTSTSLPTVLEAENLFLKGEVFLKKGDYPKAIEAFNAACAGNPSEPQYRAFLAWARFEDPRTRKEAIVRETLRVIESVVKDRPRFARGFYWLGLLWKFLNEGDKAEHAFRETVRIDNSFIEASRELRLIEMRKGRSSKPAAKPDGSKSGKFWKR